MPGLRSGMLSNVGRRIVAGTLAVAVPLAVVLGLFVHAHPDDHHADHHEAGAIHAHFAGHSHSAPHDGDQTGPGISDDAHDRPIYLRAYLSEAIVAAHLHAVVPRAVVVATPPVRPAQPPLQVVHGHDPPAIPFRPSRAPPRLPVLI